MNVQQAIADFLQHGQAERNLSDRTIRAYQSDLSQFNVHVNDANMVDITPEQLEQERVAVARVLGLEVLRAVLAHDFDARSGERTIIWNRDERLAYQPDEAPLQLADQGKVLHLDAHDPPACKRMAEAARAERAIVSADIDNVYEGLPELLPLIDILLTSKEFPHRLTGINDTRVSLIELKSRYGCPVIGMTMGKDGAMIYCEGQFIRSCAYDVPGGCRDTTGAGDAFRGGFLYGMLSGSDIERSLKLGNAVGALKCRSLGARMGLPTKSELDAFAV